MKPKKFTKILLAQLVKGVNMLRDREGRRIIQQMRLEVEWFPPNNNRNILRIPIKLEIII
jgi:hypothetical protein